jgi:hypothetical protein
MQADFLAILDTYGYFLEDYAQHLIHDVRVFLDEEVLDRIQFVWTRPASTYVIEEQNYVVMASDVGMSDDHSGGIQYRATLAKASFHVQVTHNNRWKEMDERKKSIIRKNLDLPWEPASKLDYNGGKWTADRTYSQDGYCLIRQRFKRP